MHLGERDAGTCEIERGLDQPLPREPAEPLPELAERSGEPRDGARGGSDRVHDDFLPEAHRDLGEITFLGRHGRKPVEVPYASPVEDDCVTAGEQAAVHGLGHAGGEAHGDDGIRGGPALGQDLCSDFCGGGMACSNSGPHVLILALPCAESQNR